MKPTFDPEQADTLNLNVLGCTSLLRFVLPTTLPDANETYFLRCLVQLESRGTGVFKSPPDTEPM